jgi:hypothetical protein
MTHFLSKELPSANTVFAAAFAGAAIMLQHCTDDFMRN